jgi:hypothetical protein
VEAHTSFAAKSDAALDAELARQGRLLDGESYTDETPGQTPRSFAPGSGPRTSSGTPQCDNRQDITVRCGEHAQNLQQLPGGHHFRLQSRLMS